MKFLLVLCIVAAVSCSAFAAPEESNAVLVRERRDLMDNAVKLIERLIANLRNAATQAMEAVSNFTSGVVHEAEMLRDKILNDIDRFRHRVTEAIESVFQRFTNTSAAVNTCVESHRDEAAGMFNDTVSLTMACVDNQIAEINEQIQQLRALASEAMTEATTAMEDMRKCTQQNLNILSTGSCLGTVAMHTEVKSVGFLTQSTLMIGRINLSIATLPASLEVCAGNRLIQTGLKTGKIVMDIGTCSASAIFYNITGQK